MSAFIPLSRRSQSLLAFACLMGTPQLAFASWRQVTSQMWNDSYTSLIGDAAPGCAPDSTGDPAVPSAYSVTPGRPGGGWYEWRFMGSPATTPGFFQAVGSWDVSRRCPRTFNELTTNHFHGVLSSRMAVFRGVVFSVFDSAGGYYARNAIKLQQDPTGARLPASLTPGLPNGTVNNRRPYTVIDLARNPAGYVDINPGSRLYPGPSCAGASGVDPQWATNSGQDHEGTLCAPPKQIDTFDPDLDIRDTAGGKAFVVWAERYVEGEKANPKANATSPKVAPTRGFAGDVGPLPPIACAGDYPAGCSLSLPRCLRGFCATRWFPFRQSRIHIEQIDIGALLPSGAPAHNNESTSAVPTTPWAPGGLNTLAGTTEEVSAFQPRVTQWLNAGTSLPAVIWSQSYFDFVPGEFAEPIYRPVVGATATPSTEAALHARVYLTPTTWSESLLGTECGLQDVSSGRSTGRKRIFTGTHDIATIVDSGGVERPIVVMNAKVGTACKLQVKQWDGAYWVTVASDLRMNNGVLAEGSPAWPRITVVENIPYVSWTEAPGANVYVRRQRAPGSTSWDFLGTTWNASYTKPVVGPSIVVAPNGAAAVDDGAMLYVSVVEESASGLWVATVRTCQTQVSASGVYSCQAPPALATAHARRFTPGRDLAIYDNTGRLGVAWGKKYLTDAGQACPAGFGSCVLDRQAREFVADTGMPYPAATDSALSSVWSERGANLFTSFTGPVESHRHYDHGLYVMQNMEFPSFVGDFGAGWSHTLATFCAPPRRCPELYLAGANASGQLGDGTTTPSRSLKKITLPEPIKKVAAGYDHSVALTTSGKIYLWGANASGQLCDASTSNKLSPKLAPGSTWSDIAASNAFTLALKDDGTVWACGLNSSGQLGNNTTTASTSWTQVKTGASTFLTKATSVHAGGDFACATLSDSSVWCWGGNAYGQLGRGGQFPNAFYPVAAQVAGGQTVKQLSLGGSHASLVNSANSIYTWGGNFYGQLGLGDVVARNVPTLAWSSATEQARATATLYNTYFVTSGGSLYATGDDYWGQVGVGATSVQSNSFVYVGQAEVIMGGPTAAHVYLLDQPDRDRAVNKWACWGYNASGQCVSGSTANVFVPTQAQGPGEAFGCAVGVNSFAVFGQEKMYGCGGSVLFSKRDTLCAPGYSACAAKEWVANRGGQAPTLNYWTKDPLGYSGSGSQNCAAMETGGTACVDGTPMRVCSASGSDSFGNTCNWSSCGLNATQPIEFFGGCNGNTTAGTLCCKQ